MKQELRQVRSVDQLLEHTNRGQRPKFVFFWGHTPRTPGIADASCMSQWFPTRFSLAGVEYPTAEHFMMAEKARLFGDQGMLEQILVAEDPGKAKSLGRRVAGFDDQVWQQQRWQIVVTANEAKFGQNPDLAAFLMTTGWKVLVEASPQDRIWGIGLGRDNPAALEPRKWRGLNLLGFALMEVRDRLAGVRVTE